MLALRSNGVKSCARLTGSRPGTHHAIQTLLRSSALRERPFSASIGRFKKSEQQEESQKEKPKPVPRPSAGKTSLRRVSIEAERSRVIVRNRHGRRFVDPDIDTKVNIVYNLIRLVD